MTEKSFSCRLKEIETRYLKSERS